MKVTYTQKLYYKSIAKLLIAPIICLIVAFTRFYFTATRLMTSVTVVLIAGALCREWKRNIKEICFGKMAQNSVFKTDKK